MTDIVERLNDSLSAGYSELRKEAALEIERLRAKIEQMEKQVPVAWWGRGPHDGRIEFSAHKPAPFVMRDFAVTPLYALPGAQPAPSVPEGWTLVPIEPTEKMINEGTCASTLPGPRYIDSACAKQCWTNMLAAAPEAKP